MTSLLKQRPKKGKPQGILITSVYCMQSLHALVIRDLRTSIVVFHYSCSLNLDGKQWLHPADLLTDAAAVYPVKVSLSKLSKSKFDSM